MDATVLDRLEKLSSHARKILLNSNGHAEPPIRAELFGIQRFEEHGCSLARAQIVETDAQSRRHAPFFPRLEENLAALREAYDYVALTSLSGHYATPAAEWLLDNFPLIEAQLQQIREGVPRRFYASLPKLAAYWAAIQKNEHAAKTLVELYRGLAERRELIAKMAAKEKAKAAAAAQA